MLPDESDDAARYRVEAIAAFSHEIRTPLTSLKMLIELGRRHGAEGEARFDKELTELLTLTVDELTRLVDDMQHASRMMRGMVRVEARDCRLSDVLTQAKLAMPASIRFEAPSFDDVTGAWATEQLGQAIAGIAVSVDRLGDGGGVVQTAVSTNETEVTVSLWSGGPPGSGLFFTADAGYGFFRSRQVVIAAGGRVECERSQGYALVRIKVPYAMESTRGPEDAHPAR